MALAPSWFALLNTLNSFVIAVLFRVLVSRCEDLAIGVVYWCAGSD
jgi:hypothetical protein